MPILGTMKKKEQFFPPEVKPVNRADARLLFDNDAEFLRFIHATSGNKSYWDKQGWEFLPWPYSLLFVTKIGTGWKRRVAAVKRRAAA